VKKKIGLVLSGCGVRDGSERFAIPKRGESDPGTDKENSEGEGRPAEPAQNSAERAGKPEAGDVEGQSGQECQEWGKFQTMKYTFLSSRNEKPQGEKDRKHAHLVVNDSVGEAGFAKQRIGERVAKQRSIGEGRDEDENAQPSVFEPEELTDGQGKRRPGEHYQPGNDGNIEMGLAQINAADGHEGQTRQREAEDIAHQVGQVFFPDHSCAAEDQGKAEDAGYQQYFIHGVSGRTGCPGGTKRDL